MIWAVHVPAKQSGHRYMSTTNRLRQFGIIFSVCTRSLGNLYMLLGMLMSAVVLCLQHDCWMRVCDLFMYCCVVCFCTMHLWHVSLAVYSGYSILMVFWIPTDNTCVIIRRAQGHSGRPDRTIFLLSAAGHLSQDATADCAPAYIKPTASSQHNLSAA